MADWSEAQTLDFELPLRLDSLQTPRPSSSLVEVEFGAVTHPGKKRPNNEDSYLCFRQGRFWEKLKTSLPASALPDRHTELAYVMAVADGMGGAAGGEIASRMAITIAVNLILNTPGWVMKLDNPEFREAELERGRQRAQDFFRRIDEAILKHSEKYPALRGMGTTLTAARSVGEDLFTLHVGDSRAYLFRDNKLIRLTQDQTMAQALADQGHIPREAVSHHWLRHRLTSVLGGSGGQLDLSIEHSRLRNGDRLILCSDGLTEMVDDEQIAGTLNRIQGSKKASQRLLDQALNAGGKDNITVLIAKYTLPN